MTTKNGLLVAGLLAALPVFGCVGGEGEPPSDDFAEESALDGEAGKADAFGSTFTYYEIERDMRRCMYPFCGGWHVSRVNRAYTRCADGSWEEKCYAPDIDFSESGLSHEQVDEAMLNTVLLRGDVVERDYGDFGMMNHLVVSEVWTAGTDTEPSGLFTRVTPSGIVCFTEPCFNTLHEAKLNSWLHTNLSELDFDYTGASDDQIADAYESIGTDDGLIVAGYRYYFYWDGWQKGRLLTQFYQRVLPKPEPEPECIKSGCSRQYCVDASTPPTSSTCDWLDIYACYGDNAICERGEDGRCGWRQTDELLACLADPPTT